MTVQIDLEGGSGMKGDEFGSGKSTNSPLLKALVNFLKSPNIGNAQTFNQLFSIMFPYGNRSFIPLGEASKGKPPSAFGVKRSTADALYRKINQHFSGLVRNVESGQYSPQTALGQLNAIKSALERVQGIAPRKLPDTMLNKMVSLSGRLYREAESSSATASSGGEAPAATSKTDTGVLSNVILVGILKQLEKLNKTESKVEQDIKESAIVPERWQFSVHRKGMNAALSGLREHFWGPFGGLVEGPARYGYENLAKKHLHSYYSYAEGKRQANRKRSGTFKRLLGVFRRGGGAAEEAAAEGGESAVLEGAAGGAAGAEAVTGGGSVLTGGILSYAAGALAAVVGPPVVGYMMQKFMAKKAAPAWQYYSQLSQVYRATGVRGYGAYGIRSQLDLAGITPEEYISAIGGMGLRGVSAGQSADIAQSYLRAKYIGGLSPGIKYGYAQMFGAFSGGPYKYQAAASALAGYLQSMRGVPVDILGQSALQTTQIASTYGMGIGGPAGGQIPYYFGESAQLASQLPFLATARTGALYNSLAHTLGAASNSTILGGQSIYSALMTFTALNVSPAGRTIRSKYGFIKNFLERARRAGATPGELSQYRHNLEAFSRTSLGRTFFRQLSKTPQAAFLLNPYEQLLTQTLSPAVRARMLLRANSRMLNQSPRSVIMQELTASATGMTTAQGFAAFSTLSRDQDVRIAGASLAPVFGGGQESTAVKSIASEGWRNLQYAMVAAHALGQNFEYTNRIITTFTHRVDSANSALRDLTKAVGNVTGVVTGGEIRMVTP